MINGQKTKRCVSYVRVSTVEQASEGLSLGSQRQIIADYVNRNGYDFVGSYGDEGISGRTITKRPGIQKLLEDSKEDKFDMVIIWKLSRLGRSMKDVLSIAETLYANNVELYSISESFDISTSTGKMMLGLLANFSEFERSQISENVKMSMLSLVKNQKRFAGGRMLGYRSEKDDEGKKILSIEPKEAEIVKLIFTKYLSGNGYRAIANALNKLGKKTVRGNSFSTIAVKDILNNPTYAGYLRYNRYEDWDTKRRKGYNPNFILVEGSHRPIIDKELYEKVQERLKLESRHPKRNNRGENILTGLLRCPECGGAMAASNTTNKLKDGTKKRTRYYSCANFRNKGTSVCHANSLRADEAEKFVLDRLREVIQLPNHLSGIVEELNKQIHTQREPWELELKELEVKKNETRTKIDKWLSLSKDTPELASDLRERINTLEHEYNKLNQRIYELSQILDTEGYQISEKDVEKVLQLVNSVITDATPKATVKAILRSFIEKITFDKETKDNFKIYMRFNQTVIDKLNEYKNKETTADKNAVVSFSMTGSLKIAL